MRLVYRTVAGVVVVGLVGVLAAAVVATREQPGTRPAAVAATPTLSVAPPTPTASSGGAVVASAPPASPPASSTPSSTPTTALSTALTDPRLPELPADKKLAALAGRSAPVRSSIKDERSGVRVPRFGGDWSLAKASPFASRQLLGKIRGSAYRGMLVTCPVPIEVQDSLRDTAFLAARWTLNHHPAGATLEWTASQPITVDDRDGWLLGYQVNYTIKGEKRRSMAALALVDVPESKPALVFITVPDAQKKRWRDINTVMSKIKVL
ncbi:hypothetical protein Aph01nite_67200 [Acrocarpospora phusangensis]|uniref:Alanine and proline-rich secreted protein Apa n=1 Tax=Acrocarpospora phusangensis TaxID=1070424 RepID=A0A919QJ70_9ACTN|nr:hypothetical protein [Acrocarpospora phusangensis]GIH28410.1 hypothetical protein Aph01nite_67200 [Acrocarpospora phusangensis]